MNLVLYYIALSVWPLNAGHFLAKGSYVLAAISLGGAALSARGVILEKEKNNEK